MNDSTASEQSCPNVDKCPMFPMFTLKSILEIYKRSFCHSDYRSCRRYQTMMAGTRPPAELLPDGQKLSVIDDEKA